MKENIQSLKPNEISSNVFIVAPSQISSISQQFGTELAEAMNVRPLAKKISQIAEEILIKTLVCAKKSGE